MIPPDPDAATRIREIAGQHPRWLVMFGRYSRHYLAFPLFGPVGRFMSDTNPERLAARMSRLEKASDDHR